MRTTRLPGRPGGSRSARRPATHRLVAFLAPVLAPFLGSVPPAGAVPGTVSAPAHAAGGAEVGLDAVAFVASGAGAAAAAPVPDTLAAAPAAPAADDVAPGSTVLDPAVVLADAPAAHRPALAFLLEHMPERDRRDVSAEYLHRHVAARLEARDRAPWGDALPEHLFHNDVLPYASASERRTRPGADFVELCRRLTAEARTPGEAALALNAGLFRELGVRYSTSRRAPDQCTVETAELGVATCTGLSIMLVEACRTVAVPARLAGVASWADDRGNHTWVEVWDGERWRFLGAAEPDGRGLDHAWFTGDAARAVPGHPRYAVVATSWAATDRHFPMVWAPRDRSVPGVDVTRRYLRSDDAGDPETVRLMIRTVDDAGRRVPAEVTVQGEGLAGGGGEAGRATLTTLGPEADMHRHAELAVAPGGVLRLVARAADGRTAEATLDLSTAAQGETRLVTLDLGPAPAATDEGAADAGAGAAAGTAADDAEKDAAAGGLDAAERTMARAWLDAFFAADPDTRARLAASEHPLDDRLRTAAGDAALRAIAFEAWRAAPIHEATRQDVAERRVRAGGHESPYTVRTVGERPEAGWGLVIAMHGGGGVPTPVNDRQWEVMQRYYRDQPDAPGYLYLALRAPTDAWNGFYTDYVYPLIEQLVAQLIVHADVDPDRVYAIGYSHGGYGAYAIGPKMPDRFAAVHSSAAAATDGETAAETLLNLRFTAMVGELDTAFGRVGRNRAFRGRVERLRAAHGGEAAFPVRIIEIEGNGHTGLPDRDWLSEMLPHVRDAVPHELWWRQTDGVVRSHWWMVDEAPRKGRVVRARIDGNAVELRGDVADSLELRLDARHLDLSRPIRLRVIADVEPSGGDETTSTEDAAAKEPETVERSVAVRPRLGTLAATLLDRRDPALAATVTIRPADVLAARETPEG